MNSRHKLTPADAEAIRDRHWLGASKRDLAREYGVTVPAIHQAIMGTTWRTAGGHIPSDIDAKVRREWDAPDRKLLRSLNGKQAASAYRNPLPYAPNAKLTPADVSAIRERRRAGGSVKALAAEYGVCQVTIYSVVAGKTWRPDVWDSPPYS